MNSIYLNKLYKTDKEKAFKEFISKKYILSYDNRISFMKIFEIKLLNEQKKYGNELVICQDDKLEKVFFEFIKLSIQSKYLELSDLYSQFFKNFILKLQNFIFLLYMEMTK